MLKDLLLGELTFNLACQGRLLQLPPEGAILAEKDRTGELLGDGAGALLHRALAEVAQHRPHDANVVNAIVLIKAAILSCHESLLQQQRHLAAGQLLPGSRTLLEDHFAIGRQDGEGARSRKSANAAGIGEQGIDAGDQQVLA